MKGRCIALALAAIVLAVTACGGGTKPVATNLPSVAEAKNFAVGSLPLAVGRQHACVVVGDVVCWGLFQGYVPEKVAGLNGAVTALAAGTDDTCALLQTGLVQCWGDDLHGQLGDGKAGVGASDAAASSPKPVTVIGLNDATAITTGAGHTCALTKSGGAKCWGNNTFGQLGDGTTEVRTTPVDVLGLTSGVKAIAAGSNFTCAVTTAGAAKCWGSDAAGQLGVASVGQQCGTTPLVFDCATTPVDVPGLASGVRTIGASGYGQHGCVITNDKRLKCWGSNIAGQLGVATSELCTSQACSSQPQDVGLENVTAVGVGTTHTCAATAVGGASCWGDNNAGQLGDGTRVHRSAPGPVRGLTDQVESLGAGELDTCAYLGVGDVRCWGADGAGEVGDGTAGDPICGCSMTPVSVYGLLPSENAGTPASPGQLLWPRTPFGSLEASANPVCGDQATADHYGVPRMLEFPATERLGLESEPYPYAADQLVPFSGLGRRPNGWELNYRPPLYLGAFFGYPPNAWPGPQELFLRRLDKPDLLFRYSADQCPQGSSFHPGPTIGNVNPRQILKLPAALPHVVEHRQGDYISAQQAIQIASQRDQLSFERANLPQAAAAQVRVVWAELGTADEFPSEFKQIVEINIPPPPVWFVVLSIGDLAGPLRAGHPGLARYYVIDAGTGFVNTEGGCCIGVTFSP